MANGPRYKVPFRRRREGRTDYRQRARLLRGRVPRAVVRNTLRHTSVQFITYDAKGDQVLATAILDRLLHHATTLNIKGESYRLKEKRRAGLLGRPKPADESEPSRDEPEEVMPMTL